IVTLSVDDHEECHDVTHLDRLLTVNTPTGTGQFTTYDFMDILELSCVLDMSSLFERRRPKS
ncbi:unnamed protein product, partial [Tenebrio molitor]